MDSAPGRATGATPSSARRTISASGGMEALALMNPSGSRFIGMSAILAGAPGRLLAATAVDPTAAASAARNTTFI